MAPCRASPTVSCYLSAPLPWVTKRFSDGPVCYVCDHKQKRGSYAAALGGLATLVAHSSVAFASKGSGTLATVRQALLQDLAEKVPARLDVEETVLHKWDPAEVQRGYYNKAEKKTQSGCMQLSPSAWPAVLLAGDAFAPTADFEGCVDVAFRTVAHLASLADAAQ
ncbi:hypothetical protein DIPPA_34670 [Diplonema papillatum]|nr:hypothetical protein DIPPA_34670 [Diplonema papillatum]